MTATWKPQPVTRRWARPDIAGCFLWLPPPWAIRTRGARSAALEADDQRTPGMPPRVKSRSSMPFDDDWAVNCSAVKCRECMGVAFREGLVVEALPATPTSTASGDGRGDHPHGSSFHGSPLLGWCHGRKKAIKRSSSRQSLFPPCDPSSRQALVLHRQVGEIVYGT